jgi:hypothetical protein
MYLYLCCSLTEECLICIGSVVKVYYLAVTAVNAVDCWVLLLLNHLKILC